MVIGGGIFNHPYNDTEVINLRPETGASCHKPPNVKVDDVVTFIDGHVIVCCAQCYVYDNVLDQWNETFKFDKFRVSPAGVKLTEEEWWVLGGFAGGWMDTTEMCEIDRGYCRPHVYLIEESYYPTAIKVNESLIFVLNGKSGLPWLYHVNTAKFSRIPAYDGLDERKHLDASGGVLKSFGKEYELVIAGGEGTNATDILNLETLEWRVGPELPFEDLIGFQTVQYENTFIIVGGIVHGKSGDSVDTLIMFDIESDDWVILDQRMEKTRGRCAAVLVPYDHIECN